MRVAVVGASGRTGKAVVARLLGAGHEVVAVVRDAATAPAGTVAIADARDIPALTAAVTGCDAVITALGHVKTTPDADILTDGARALVAAMDAGGVRRLVAVSAGGAYVAGDDPLSRFVAKPIVMRLFFTADTRGMEDAFRASDLEWTMLRPSRLIAGTSTKPYRARLDAAVWWHYSTRFDTVARAALDALDTPSWVGHAVFITE